MYNEEKLNSRLSLYYEALAQEETLSDREREKLVKDINREIERINKMADRYREAHKKLVEASDELSTRLRDTEKSTKRHFGIKNAPANGTIFMLSFSISNFLLYQTYLYVALSTSSSSSSSQAPSSES